MKKFASKALAGVLSLAMVFGVTLVAAPKTASAKVKVTKVTATSPSGKTLYVAKGKKVKISTTVKVTPNKKANKKVTYKSANNKIATVTSKGYVKGVKAGKTKITVTSKKNSKKKATVKVVVKKAAVKKVTLSAKTATLAVGAKKTLKAKVTPTKNTSSKIAWSTSNKKVATVTSKGVVKGVKEGTATITAKAADGSGKKATCKVTVGAGIASLSVMNSRIVRITLTSAKQLSAANFTVQDKTTPSGNYNMTEGVETVRTADKKTYDIVLDSESGISSYSYVKVTIPVLSVDRSKEIYVTNVPSYSTEYTTQETTSFVTGMVGDTYSDTWNKYDIDVPTTGYVKVAATGLPAGLKAYTSKDGSSVRIAGKFTSVVNGAAATLTATDETGKTYTKKYVFYVGDKNHIVGTVIAKDQLAYIPDDGKTVESESSGLYMENYVDGINSSYVDSGSRVSYGTRIVMAGGSESYKYELTVPAALGAYTTDEYGNKDFSAKEGAVAAGKYRFTLTVTDGNNLTKAIAYDLNLVTGTTFTGTVKDAAGAPAKGVDVYGYTKDDAYGRSDSISVTTKADGTYKTRVIPGDYYLYTSVSGVQSNASTGNVFGASAATKDFVIPQYCVKFATNIAGAGAYSGYGYGYSYGNVAGSTNISLMDSYGNNVSVYVDGTTDFGMYAYLRAGSYVLVPVGEGSTTNTIYAYKKYTPGDSTKRPSLDSDDLIGRYTLSGGAFNVAGNTTVRLTGTVYKASED